MDRIVYPKIGTRQAHKRDAIARILGLMGRTRKQFPARDTNQMQEAFVKNVDALVRRAAGVDDTSTLTVVQYANHAGIPKNTLFRLRSMDGGCTLRTLLAIAAKFKLPLWQLFIPKMDVTAEAELMAIFRELDDSARAELLGYARGLRQKKPALTLVQIEQRRKS